MTLYSHKNSEKEIHQNEMCECEWFKFFSICLSLFSKVFDIGKKFPYDEKKN